MDGRPAPSGAMITSRVPRLMSHTRLPTNHSPLTTNHSPLTTNHSPLTTNLSLSATPSHPVFREKLPLPLEKNPLGDKNFKAVWPQLVSRGKRLYGLVMEIPWEDRAGHIIPKELVMETVKRPRHTIPLPKREERLSGAEVVCVL